MHLKKQIFLFTVIAAFVSCKQKDRSTKYFLAPVGTAAAKELPAQEASGKYYYHISNSVSFTADAQGGELTNSSSAETGLTYELLQPDSSGNRQIKFSFEKLHAETKKNGEKQVFDADNAGSVDRMDKMLRTIRGSVVTARFDSKGNFLGSEGAKEITQKVLADLSDLDADSKAVVAARLQKLAGDEFVKENFAEMNKALPDTAVHIGSKWAKTTMVPGEINLAAKTVFELSGIDGDVATVEYSSDISNDAGKALNIMGNNINADISGNQKGSFEVDMKTGRITAGESIVKLEGMIAGAGSSIPVIINIKRIITSKKF